MFHVRHLCIVAGLLGLATVGLSCAGPAAPQPGRSPTPDATDTTPPAATSLPATPTSRPTQPALTTPSSTTPTPAAPATLATPAATPGGEAKVPPGAEGPVDVAKKDLARRTGVAAANIKVERVDEVEWSDAALGCPKPGQMYAQVIVPGYRVILAAGDKEYEYHTDKGSNAVLCEQQ